MLGFLQGRDVFVQDCDAGAQPEYRLPLRIVTEHAWHSLFARNMFTDSGEPRGATASTCRTSRSSARRRSRRTSRSDGTRTSTFIVLSFERRLCLIGGTGYAGEMKKSVFTVLNYLLPLEGVLSMHCSANVGDDGDVGALLRALRHRQDDAVRGPTARPDRRRRARLERRGRLQPRGRLLREGDPALAALRAGDLRGDAAVRHGARERRLRPGDASRRPRRRLLHREHARLLPARLHPARRPVAHAPAIRTTSCC